MHVVKNTVNITGNFARNEPHKDMMRIDISFSAELSREEYDALNSLIAPIDKASVRDLVAILTQLGAGDDWGLGG